MKIELNGRMIALDGYVPLRIKDWAELETRYGLSPDRLAKLGWQDMINLAHFMIAKADPSVTKEEIGDLLPDSPIFVQIAQAVSTPKASSSTSSS